MTVNANANANAAVQGDNPALVARPEAARPALAERGRRAPQDGNDAARPAARLALAECGRRAPQDGNDAHRGRDGRNAMSAAERGQLAHQDDGVHRRRDGSYTMSTAERGRHIFVGF